MTIRPLQWPLLGLATLIFAGPAQAAPQILALLETDTATKLVCEDGTCRAEFTTYCLQKERDIPVASTPYEVAKGHRLNLVLTDADGTTSTVPATEHVRVATARRGHTAVVIEIDESALAKLGAISAAIEFGGGVALTPVPTAGDPNPQTAQDIALAVGPLRMTGTRKIDKAGGTVETVWALNRLVNAVPEGAGKDRTARAGLWRRAMNTPLGSAPKARVETAAQEFKTCWDSRVVEVGAVSLKSCLQRRHDRLMWDNVLRYWDAVGAGT